MNGISLVMATMNRPGDVCKFIETLLVQKYKLFELIIVDQSNAENKEILEKLVHGFKGVIDVTLLHTPIPGLSRARNIGINFIKYDIVGFPDDDCWYSPEVLNFVFQKFSDRKLDFLSGQYTEPGIKNSRYPEEEIKINSLKKASLPSSVSLFVAKWVMDSGVRFDERVGAGTSLPIGEETDFVMSMVNLNCNGLYINDHIVYHKIIRGEIGDFKKDILRERARGYIIGKNAKTGKNIFWALLGVLKLVSVKRNYALVSARVDGLRLGWRI